MASELFTIEGQRKYLDEAEHDHFLTAAAQLERGEVRTLCTTLAYTGCRIFEALELTADRIDLSSQVITFRSLEKRGKTLYRSVPVPESHLDTLGLVHGLGKTQRAKSGSRSARVELGPHAGHQARVGRHDAAGITGPQSCPKGLRHGFGVRLAMKTRNPRLVQRMLGHASLETTAIYMDVVEREARDEMALTW